MSEPEPKKAAVAWQPFTPKGVAAFSDASLARVFSFQFAFAAINALALAWFLQISWFPVISAAVARLPASGEISQQRLEWPSKEPVLLGYNSDLALIVDRQHLGAARVPADLLLELGDKDARVYSLFGYLEFPYQQGYRIGINQTELRPWWGAWRPPILWISVAGCILVLMLTWSALAAIYALAVWLIAFFSNRTASLRQSWRIASAAMMPASLLLGLSIVLYGAGAVSLPGFLLLAASHWIAGCLYALIAPLALKPDASAPPKGNPFAGKEGS